MKKITPYLKPYKAQLIVGPSFKLLEAILELLIPTLMVSIIDKGVANKDMTYILKMGGLMLIIATVGYISALICQHQASIASQGFGTDLRNGLFKHIQTLSARDRENFAATDFTTRITNDINALQLAVAMIIRLIIRAPFISIGSIVMALIINPKLALIVILTLPILTIIIVLIMRKTIPLYKKTMKSLDKLSLIIKENLQGVRVIRAFARQKEEKKRFNEESENFSSFSIKGGKISSLLNPLTSLVMNLAIILILYFSGINIQSETMTQGEIIAFINYVSYMVVALLVTANLVVLFARAYTSSQRVSQVLSIEKSQKEGTLSSINLENEYALEFDSVYFAYNQDLYILKDISFKLKEGASLGIIGSTGSGKSSLANLIIRHYDPNLGHIKFYGKDIKEYRIKSIRENVSLVSQESIIFSASIEENIRQGKEDADFKEVYGAAKDAMALDFIEARRDKFASKIERGGSNLSGGQKQRLSIARALVKKPKILILDDSLSTLDYLTDARLRENLRRYKMTRIIISQRINSIQDCDNILVLEKGQAIGYGNHKDLLGTCIVYQELVESQLGGGEIG